MSDSELEGFKRIDLRNFAEESYGYALDRRKSCRSSTVMRHPNGDKNRHRHAGLHFGAGRCVLVIDNAEHLIESVADLISDLRIHCERLPILVTSQRPTFLADEETHRIGPLPAQAAIDLFNALSDNSANGAYAETICRAVDQLPLASRWPPAYPDPLCAANRRPG